MTPVLVKLVGAEPFAIFPFSRVPCTGESFKIDDIRYEIVNVSHQVFKLEGYPLSIPGGLVTVVETKE